MDNWNAKDDFEQERNRMADKEQDDLNTEDDATAEDPKDLAQSNDESSSTSLDTRTKPGGNHLYSDEKTMDLFSSDTNQTADMPEENDHTNDSGESIRLRLDSLEDTQDGTSLTSYTKVKSPTTFKEQSSDGSLSFIQAGQEMPKNIEKNKQNNNTNGFTPFSTIKKLLGVDCSSESAKLKVNVSFIWKHCSSLLCLTPDGFTYHLGKILDIAL